MFNIVFSNSWRSWQPFPSLLNLWKFPFFFSLHSLYTRLTLHCHGNDVTVSHLHISLLLNTAKKEHGSMWERDTDRDTERERDGERQRRRKGSVSLETDWGSPQPPLVLNWLKSACYPQCLEPTESLFLGCLCPLCLFVSTHSSGQNSSLHFMPLNHACYSQVCFMLIHNQIIKHQSPTGSYLVLFCNYCSQEWMNLQLFFWTKVMQLAALFLLFPDKLQWCKKINNCKPTGQNWNSLWN